MTNDEQVLAVLNQILVVQRTALSNQEKLIGQNALAVQRQATQLRLYKIVLMVLGPIMAFLIYFMAMGLQGRS